MNIILLCSHFLARAPIRSASWVSVKSQEMALAKPLGVSLMKQFMPFEPVNLLLREMLLLQEDHYPLLLEF